MNRRTLVSLAAVAAASQALPSSHRTRAATDFESGGLGLTIDDWDDMFGAGEPGQTYMSYTLNDGNYWVGIDTSAGVVDFIERNWDNPEGVPLADAEDEARSLLPEDARHIERFDANYAAILYGSQIDRYESRDLGDRFDDDRSRAARSFAVIYEKVPAPASMDYYVTRMVIIVAAEPSE